MSTPRRWTRDVAEQHIALYVNEFTRRPRRGRLRGGRALLGRAMKEGLVPLFDLAKLRA